MALLTAADFAYTGAFYLPNGYNNGSRFAYGDRGLVYDPVNDCFFVSCHRTNTYESGDSLTGGNGVQSMKWGKAGIVASKLSALNVAPLVQNNYDPTIVAGSSTWKQAMNAAATNHTNKMWGGGFVYDGRFYCSATVWYDASGTNGDRGTPNLPAVWSRALDLSSTDCVGPVVIETPAQGGTFSTNYPNTAWYDGWKVKVPAAFQAALGWKALTGNGTMSIVGRQSYGVSLMGFNPEDIGGGVYAGTAGDPIPSQLLMGFNATHPMNEADRVGSGTPIGWTSEMWNGTTGICGCIWPEDSDTIIFMGSQGLGALTYSGGYTPADGRRTQLWLVDANDLVAVVNGTKAVWEVFPYEIVPITGMIANNGTVGRGLAFKESTRSMFFRAQSGETTLVHTWTIAADGGGPDPDPEPDPDPDPDPDPVPDPDPAPEPGPEVVIRWLRRSTHTVEQQRRVRHVAAQMAAETGVGLTSGQGSDPQVMLRWSDNGGHTWGNEHWTSMGMQGQYKARALWRRLGQGRNRVYEVSGSDPVKVAILDLYLNVERDPYRGQ